MIRFWVIVSGIGMILLGVCFFMSLGMATPLRSETSPSGKYYVSSLPFKGSSPSKLDGTLRLYVCKDRDINKSRKIQIDILYSRGLKFTWAVDRSNDVFSIVGKDGVVLATCRVGEDSLKWTAGAEHIVPDPYEAQYRSR
jgi:hypothetical protein